MRVAVLLLAALTLAGCSGGAVQIEPPRPDGEAAAMCDRLAGLLPQRLDGADRAETSPKSAYVAVWGEAEIAVRCGVQRPAKMAATDQLTEIDGVGWYPDPDKPTLFTAIMPNGYIEALISRTHNAPKVLVDLSTPLANLQ